MIGRTGIIRLARAAMSSELGRVVQLALAPILVGNFLKKSRNARSIDASLSFAVSFRFMGVSIAPYQIREEISELLRLLNSLKPSVVLEIGTANGGTLFLFTRVATDNALIMSVDLPEGRFGGGYPAWKSKLFKSFALNGQEVHLVRANSHDPETLNDVRSVLGNRPVDFLFIDGDHTYEGVQNDYEMYSSLVRSGGIIAFHDICQGPEEAVGGVPRFWSELRKGRDFHEIVMDVSQGGYGIGIIIVTSCQ